MSTRKVMVKSIVTCLDVTQWQGYGLTPVSEHKMTELPYESGCCLSSINPHTNFAYCIPLGYEALRTRLPDRVVQNHQSLGTWILQWWTYDILICLGRNRLLSSRPTALEITFYDSSKHPGPNGMRLKSTLVKPWPQRPAPSLSLRSPAYEKTLLPLPLSMSTPTDWPALSRQSDFAVEHLSQKPLDFPNNLALIFLKTSIKILDGLDSWRVLGALESCCWKFGQKQATGKRPVDHGFRIWMWTR